MKKLKIGIIGVGRLGYEHACNIANRVPGSELVAIADANFDRTVGHGIHRFCDERGERYGIVGRDSTADFE